MTEETQESQIEMTEYTYDNLLEFAKEWADMNDMTADMMHGILQIGINSYENSYAGYSLAMQAYSNHEASKKED